MLGVKGVLLQMAERGQLLDLECEMPQCYHQKGRAAFDPVAETRSKWAPSPDHYPTLKSAGGRLVPENVRLSHTECNQRDYTRRKQIGTLLAQGKSLAEIAETLNRRNVVPAHGTNRWTAAMVRNALLMGLYTMQLGELQDGGYLTAAQIDQLTGFATTLLPVQAT